MTEKAYRDPSENLAIGLFQKTPDGRILDADSAMAGVLGFASPAEPISTSCDMGRRAVVDPEQRERVGATALRNGRIDRVEILVHQKKVAEFPANIGQANLERKQ